VTDVPPEEPPADPRDALIRAQAERIAALEAMVADLREQLAAAERSGSRNSGNSSMPPSSDDLPGRKPPRRQRRAAERAEKKKRGKQPGSPGAAMRWEVPDRTEDYYPEGACSCGRDLSDAADLGVARSFQQEEIPAAAAERVQHDLHSAKCACGKRHVAPRPASVPDSALSIGPRLRALAVYLVVFQHVPVERCRQLIADVAGAAVSEGFIHSCLARASAQDRVAQVEQRIGAGGQAPVQPGPELPQRLERLVPRDRAHHLGRIRRPRHRPGHGGAGIQDGLRLAACSWEGIQHDRFLSRCGCVATPSMRETAVLHREVAHMREKHQYTLI